ncbi:glycosyltransferase [uncultured Sphaerotilus sp.]|uniref:glycosyltransferase n=1 Tax=uncultured Sphaerotilus sp. TaxID=474984 RepID=UPI0030CA4F15
MAESIRSRGVRLVEMGHEVEVVSLDDPDAPFIANYALKLHPLGKGRTAWQYQPDLVTWIRANSKRFDAVVVDGIWQYHAFATRQALAGSGIPYYVFPHGMLDPWFKHTYPLKHLKKWLFWPWAEYRVLRDARAVLFTCEEERRLAKESFWLYQVNERLAPLGTTEPPDNSAELTKGFLSAFPLLRQKPFLLFLGRIHPKKGCDLLLNAFAANTPDHPDQHLVMAGPSDEVYLAELKNQARSLGIEQRVHWIGMVKGDTKWGALYACDAFVLPSHQENFGIAVVEAMACAKPILISNKVNIWREALQDGSGLVEPDTLTGTSALLKRWFQQPAKDRLVLAKQARQTYEQRYTVDASADALLHAVSH